MTNRLALALAVAGGYVLGRTKKAKLAIGIGGMVLGKRLQLSPQQILGAVNEKIAENPQLGELRDQLRGDLKGVGKAATGALVTRRLDSLANSLHERTLDVRDRIDSGKLTGGLTGEGEDGSGAEEDKPGEDTYESRSEGGSGSRGGGERGRTRGRGRTRRTQETEAEDRADAEETDEAEGAEGDEGAEEAAAEERRAKGREQQRKRPAKKTAPAAKKTASAAKRTAPAAGKTASKTASAAKKTAAKPASRRNGGGGRG
ncbi:DNA primase [Streptomyces sp. MST-110588]|uniref:DNA primase n=1 Tax=Streptomyces sp. MST-110588 TaxID=2833628 RepID=UPI001F5E185A|nr:DNA primase [Streptomyces sp. MST-110588]UNO42868.1 DNA primase [Streptomyces sp. MST-110588]